MHIEFICILISIVCQIGAVYLAAKLIRGQASLNLWTMVAVPLVAILLLELDWMLNLHGGMRIDVLPSELSRAMVATIASALLLAGVIVIQRLILELEEKKEIERKSAEKFRGLLESAPDGMVILNQQNEIKLVNAQFVRMFGHAREEMIGKQVEWLMPVGFPNAHAANWEGYVQSPDSGPLRTVMELSGLRKNGEEFPIELSLSPLSTEEGFFISAGVRDVTGRKRMESKNRELATLLDKANDAIILQDLDDRIVFWSQGAVRAYGWSVEEASGKSLPELLHIIPVQFRQARSRTTETGSWAGELQQTAKDLKELTVRSGWTLVRDPAGKPVSILTISTDITKEKQFEAQYLRVQRLENIGTLASGIAHDLNNILAPILMTSEMLMLRELDATSRDMGRTIQSGAQRGAQLVRQILSFARGSTTAKKEVQLRHLLKEIARLTKETFPPSIQISTDVPSDLWPVLGDATQLDQVIMNLCVNARDAMPGGGRLRIRANNVQLQETTDTIFTRASLELDAKPGPYVLLTVSDTGTGIPVEIQDRIFDPFFTTKELGKGTGLGLATVASIVKSHGGLIHFETELGKGTAFKVHLPAITNPVPEQPRAEGSGPRRGQGEWIMVVDDETALREGLTGSLEHFGYHVLAAKDGMEALTIYTHNRDRVRMVLTDLMMPNLAGPSLIRVLNTMEPKLPILAFSGLPQSDYHNLLADCTISAFLQKPFSLTEVVNLVSDTLEGKKA